jgi:uncharacterized membrane protein (UPF0127 family)
MLAQGEGTFLDRARRLAEEGQISLGGAGGEAMVFSFDADSDRTFWMKDTVLPLSIAWIDGEGAVIGTADMDPCPATSTNCEKFSAERPYRLAIEMAQGRLQDWGIRPGATVSLGASC